MRFVSTGLGVEHRAEAFDCGVPELSEWLRVSALDLDRRGLSRTFVWTRPARDDVLAYYSLSAHRIARSELSSRLGRGGPAEVPAVLIGKLALDLTLHGQGLGSDLLVDALARVVRASRLVAARFVVVDAIDEPAARFYEHHGFRRLASTSRLVQRMSDVAAAVG